MKFLLRALLLVAVVSAVLWPSQAQAQDGNGFSDEEQEWLDYISVAFANFYALETYQYGGEQTLDQIVSAVESPVTVSLTMKQEYKGDVILPTEEGDLGATSQKIEQNMTMYTGSDPIEQGLTSETVLVDGQFYVRYAGDDMALGIGEEWINLTENPTAVPGADIINLEKITSVSSSFIPNIVLDEITVNAVTELEGETLNEKEMRVFEVAWNFQALYEANGFNLKDLFNFESIGLDTEAFIASAYDNAVMTQRIWIGVEDENIHQVALIMNVNAVIGAEVTGGVELNLNQKINSTMGFFNFNKPLLIVAPIEE